MFVGKSPSQKRMKKRWERTRVGSPGFSVSCVNFFLCGGGGGVVFEITFIKALRVREDGLKKGFENRKSVSAQKRGRT